MRYDEIWWDMMIYVEVLPNKDLADVWAQDHHIAYIVFRSIGFLHPMRWSKGELLKWEQTEIEIWRKRSLRKERCTDPFSFLELSSLKRLIGALSFHSFGHGELQLKRVLPFHKCVANVFVFAAGWNFRHADPKGEDIRNISEVAMKSNKDIWSNHVESSLPWKRTWRSGNQRWSAFGSQT